MEPGVLLLRQLVDFKFRTLAMIARWSVEQDFGTLKKVPGV